ncbi:MAG: hypothetical protein AAAB13_17560 [Pseudomonas sp.]
MQATRNNEQRIRTTLPFDSLSVEREIHPLVKPQQVSCAERSASGTGARALERLGLFLWRGQFIFYLGGIFNSDELKIFVI